MTAAATRHEVVQGDTLVSIAHKYGFNDWRRIYEAPENEALRAKRPHPMLLAPGDVVVVPEKAPATFIVQPEQKHTFRLAPPLTAYVGLTLEDEDDRPYANKRYTLVVGAKTYEGRTDPRGFLEHRVAPDAREATLTLHVAEGETQEWTLELGHLAPIDLPAGVQDRLNNLGYTCEDESHLGPALESFQHDCGLPVTGKADDATRTKLVELHDGAPRS
jgi:hypothetical protein